MNTLINTEDFLIIESSINKSEEQFEVFESRGTFAHDVFILQIKREMKFYEITFEGLAKSINITNFRLGALLNGNAEFTSQETKLIRNRLHF